MGWAAMGSLTLEIADRVGHRCGGQSGDGDDVAGFGLVHRHALEAAEGQHLGDAALLDGLAVARQRLDRLVRLDRAGAHAAGEHAAKEGVQLDGRHQHAEGAILDHRRIEMLHHQIEERRHAVLRPGRAVGHPALLGRAVDDREVELLLAGVKIGEEIEDLVHHLVVALVRAVDLVDADDGTQPDLEGLLQHELGLRHGAFGGVHQQHGTVHHVEDALHLAAEVGVARRVDDVDAGVFPGEGGDLGQDGDAALALEIVGVHGAFGNLLVVAERAGLRQEPVDQGGLAVVDVGNDGDVAQIHGARRLS